MEINWNFKCFLSVTWMNIKYEKLAFLVIFKIKAGFQGSMYFVWLEKQTVAWGYSAKGSSLVRGSERIMNGPRTSLLNIFLYLLAHLSWRFKWAFLIKICPLSIIGVVVRVIVNFSHIHLLLQNHWTNFNQIWQKASFDKGDSSLFK